LVRRQKMDRNEFKVLVKAMKAVYADPKFIPDGYAFDVWYSLLQDLEYKTASITVQKYMLSNKFPPAISDIREQYVSITNPKELNEMEAWSRVSRALRNGYYGAEQEFNKLPPLVQKAVGSPSQLRNWSQTSIESIENVIQSNFMRTYRSVVSKEREVEKMQEKVKKAIKVNSGNAERLEG